MGLEWGKEKKKKTQNLKELRNKNIKIKSQKFKVRVIKTEIISQGDGD